MIPCRIRARATLKPSEDPDKVLEAIRNMMPSCEGAIRGHTAESDSESLASLDTIRESLMSRGVAGALRRSMTDNTRNNTTRLLLNRQAAYAGVAAICETPDESPLGPIEIEIESRRIHDIIRWMTTDGTYIAHHTTRNP